MIEPRNDYLLVEREETPQGIIYLTNPDKSLYGRVLAVGPKCCCVRKGMRIMFNSKWNDFAADHYQDLPLGANKRLHLIQEGDIFSIV